MTLSSKIALRDPHFYQPMDILDGASLSESETEVAPQDYSKCVQLHGPPRVGDRIAFKVTFLENNQSWAKLAVCNINLNPA